MDTRFVQAHKEARWALGLTLLYLAVWLDRDIPLEDDDAA